MFNTIAFLLFYSYVISAKSSPKLMTKPEAEKSSSPPPVNAIVKNSKLDVVSDVSEGNDIYLFIYQFVCCFVCLLLCLFVYVFIHMHTHT